LRNFGVTTSREPLNTISPTTVGNLQLPRCSYYVRRRERDQKQVMSTMWAPSDKVGHVSPDLDMAPARA
jgi:hypothetical protein